MSDGRRRSARRRPRDLCVGERRAGQIPQLHESEVAARDGCLLQQRGVVGEPGADEALGIADGVVEAVVPEAVVALGERGQGGCGVGGRDGEEVARRITPAEGGAAVDAAGADDGWAGRGCAVYTVPVSRSRPGGRSGRAPAAPPRPSSPAQRASRVSTSVVGPPGVDEDRIPRAPGLRQRCDGLPMVVRPVARIGPNIRPGSTRLRPTPGPAARRRASAAVARDQDGARRRNQERTGGEKHVPHMVDRRAQQRDEIEECHGHKHVGDDDPVPARGEIPTFQEAPSFLEGVCSRHAALR